ncbi:hypothetical protein EVAR_36029_1 [Eumeta japonica]|uniref:Uncharacterized protein n=1 Tax=Eumeta variegata TaxID=151549 RepID=A0A4C1WS36_EUMVA|nr:hypothetical protein EVAR_36029_1 [Eumeta japonica]
MGRTAVRKISSLMRDMYRRSEQAQSDKNTTMSLTSRSCRRQRATRIRRHQRANLRHHCVLASHRRQGVRTYNAGGRQSARRAFEISFDLAARTVNSKTVLAWLRFGPHPFKQFVAERYRVAEIKKKQQRVNGDGHQVITTSPTTQPATSPETSYTS